MKLKDITSEHQILNAPMNEMANLFPDETGISYIIWFGEVGGQHGPRIKVSNVKGKFALNDNFVISVTREPIVLTPNSMKIKKDELDDIVDWVKINYKLLMEMWKMYETGTGKPSDLIQQLQKIR